MHFFERVRERAKLDHLAYSSGTHMISIHIFRSWFITHADKVDFGLGHALAGQSYYQKRYNRYTEKEMLEFFLKAENILSPYEVHQTENQEELKAKIAELESKTMEFESKKDVRIANLEKKLNAVERILSHINLDD